MEIVKPGILIDFMRHRRTYMLVSFVLVFASIVSVFFPGPNFGIDFAGGTEIQLAFSGNVDPGAIREILAESGYERPDVVAVQAPPGSAEGRENEYIIRIREVSALNGERQDEIRERLVSAVGEGTVERIRFSPGGDKITIDLSAASSVELIETTLNEAGLPVIGVAPFGQAANHVYEARLRGVAQELIEQLRASNVGEFVPDTALRIEWVGPRAGAQLRDAAIQSLLYAIAFIMVYVAFRFDLRYAPGAVVAMAHDATITMGVFVLLQKEFNLTIVAALLTIIGYSINDTIVVYDRIRENLGRYRDRSLYDVINISTSQMLSRTIVTSGTTLLSVSAFFIWGTSVIRDISFALFIGILIGTYSSIYVAAPLTEWMDQRFFRKESAAAKRRKKTASKKQAKEQPA